MTTMPPIVLKKESSSWTTGSAESDELIAQLKESLFNGRQITTNSFVKVEMREVNPNIFIDNGTI